MNTNADPERPACSDPPAPCPQCAALRTAIHAMHCAVADTFCCLTMMGRNADVQHMLDRVNAALAAIRDIYPAPALTAPVRGASAVDAPTPPADAQEPPWVVAAQQLASPVVRYSTCERVIKAACESHAAALAQETCLPFSLTDERVQRLQIFLDAAVKERNELRDKTAALAQERDRWQASWHVDTTRLTAERDRLRAVLQATTPLLVNIKDLFPTGDSQWEVSLNRSAVATLAQIDAALAPTQKEEK